MLKSMTGFGRAERSVGGKTFLVDIKSLNGKQFEAQLACSSVWVIIIGLSHSFIFFCFGSHIVQQTIHCEGDNSEEFLAIAFS